MAFDEFGFDDAEEGGFGLDGEVEEGGAVFLLVEVGAGAVDVFHGGVFGGGFATSAEVVVVDCGEHPWQQTAKAANG